MKIDFVLTEQHQAILGIIFREGGKISNSQLQKVFLLERLFDNDISRDKIIEIQPHINFSSLPGSRSIKRMEKEIQGLIFVGLIKKGKIGKATATGLLLTKEGSRLAKAIEENRRLILRPKESLQTTVFIACAFGRSDIDDLYNLHLAPTCENLGYIPVRVDMTEPHQTITEKIMGGITDAACVIADLTYARPSVYFEVGYTVGLGIPFLVTCRKDHFHGDKDDQRIHFDLEQYKTSFWELNTSGNFSWQSESMKPDKRLALILQSRK